MFNRSISQYCDTDEVRCVRFYRKLPTARNFNQVHVFSIYSVQSSENVFQLSSRAAALRWILRSSSVLYSHLLLCHSVFTYVNRMDDPYSLLFLMQLFFSVVSFQSVLRNRSKIESIVEEICRCSNSHVQLCLQNLSKVLFLLWVLVSS